MAKSTGRNDPCPCGSGLKYKRCCGRNAAAATPAVKAHDGAVSRALDWLNERHRKAFRLAMGALLNSICGAEEQAALAELDASTLGGIDINLTEWLLAEGEIEAHGIQRRIADVLLGPGGPLFTVGQRAWLQQLSSLSLRLYDVTDVVPGKQITLCDTLELESEPIVVLEHSGSQTLQVGTKAGFRVMPVDGHHELSGAAYPFSLLTGPAIADRLQEIATSFGEAPDLRQILSRTIMRGWIQQYTLPPPVPQVMDAYSGEPIQLITDHYEVVNWEQLEQALAMQADVHGSHADGWNRLLDCEDGQTRCLATLTAGKRSDRIEAFYKTKPYADAGRVWFEALAGQAARYLARDWTNPWKETPQSADSHATPGPAIPPEALAELATQALRRAYANWADEPIPALGNQTPRAAIRTPAGLERVKGLLRSYEDGEARQAAAQGRHEIAYQFLWDALGLSR